MSAILSAAKNLVSDRVAGWANACAVQVLCGVVDKSFPRKSREREVPHRGFTLVELMVVLTIMGVLATMCVPTFEQALKQSRADIAAANLRAIWSAERLYWLEYHSYTSDSHLQTLQNLGVLDKTITSTSGSGGYNYEVTNVAPLQATATSQQGGISITIDENGELQYTGITGGVQ